MAIDFKNQTPKNTLPANGVIFGADDPNSTSPSTYTKSALIDPNTVTSVSGGTTGLTPAVPTSGDVVISGTLVVSHGGTGVTTKTGTGNVVLSDNPTLVAPVLGQPASGDLTNCTDLPLTTGITGVLDETNGGTGQSSYTIGDLLYASSATALSKLPDAATGNALISGGVGAPPSWGKVGLTTHVSGTLPVANGGTGVTTLSALQAAVLPSQGGNSGKYLTTNGSTTSWAGSGQIPLFYDLVTDLRSVTPTVGANAVVGGYYTDGDGGGGDYYGASQATFKGTLSFTSAQNSLNVTQVTNGPIYLGMVISGGTIAAGTVITGFISGTLGGVGVYTVSIAQTVTVSTDITGKFVDNGGTVIVPTGGDGSVAWLAVFNGTVNVKQFGAKGDGATNDSVAIQAAINAVFARGDGGIVYLPPGDFVIGTTLNLTDFNRFAPTSIPTRYNKTLKILGAGGPSSRLIGGEIGYGFFEMLGANNIQFEGFTIYANRNSNYPQYGICGGRNTGDLSSGGYTFTDVIITGNFSFGCMFMLSSEVNYFENCVFYPQIGHGCIMAMNNLPWSVVPKYSTFGAGSGGNGDNQFTNCQFFGTTTNSPSDIPLALEYAQYFRLTSCYWATSTNTCHIYLRKSASGTIQNGFFEKYGNFVPYSVYFAADDATDPSDFIDYRDIQITGSRLLRIYSENNNRITSMKLENSVFRGTYLYQSAFFNASFNGGAGTCTMTVVGSATGTIAIGQYVKATGLPANAVITAGSGSTWTITYTGTIGALSSRSVISGYDNPATFTGSITGTTLTVTGVTGLIDIGQTVSGPGVPADTTIVSGSGSTWTVNYTGATLPSPLTSVAMTSSAYHIDLAKVYDSRLESSNRLPNVTAVPDVTLRIRQEDINNYYNGFNVSSVAVTNPALDTFQLTATDSVALSDPTQGGINTIPGASVQYSGLYALITSGNVPNANQFAIMLDFVCPSIIDSNVRMLYGLGAAATNLGGVNTVSMYMFQGNLHFRSYGPTAGTGECTYRVTAGNFVTNFSGKRIKLLVVQDGTGVPVAYINGYKTSLTPVIQTGTRTWAGTVAGNYLMVGYQSSATTSNAPTIYYSAALFNYAPNAAKALQLTTVGITGADQWGTNFGGGTNGCIGYWDFESGGGTTVYDQSPFAQTATISGTVTRIQEANKKTALQKIDNIANLRNTPVSSVYNVELGGYYTNGDGGGGGFYGVIGASPGTYVDNGGTVIVPTGGDGSSAWLRVYDGVVNVRWFGAKGIGASFDDTNAILAAAAVCNAAKRTGLAAHIFHPGLTLDFDSGTYYLGAAAATIPIECNVTHSGAGILVIVSFAGEVFRIGMDVSGQLLSTANIVLPDVYKPTLSPEPYTGTGVRIKNLNASEVRLGRVDYFDKCHHFGGKGQGTVYCDIYLGQSTYGKTLIYIVPETSGWFNVNNIYGGNLAQYGTRKSNYYHVYMDGSTSSAIYDNSFYGTSFEGDGAQYIIYAKVASNNKFYGCYFETGRAAQAVTVTGGGSATITRTAHGFSVGDMLSFIATVLPTGMLDSTPYYVTATPTPDTFEVSINKGGTSQTFATSGTTVSAYLQPVLFFDGTASNTSSNVLDEAFTVPSLFLNVVEISQALNNGLTSRGNRSARNFLPNDIPQFRSANTSAAAGLTLAQFAAYGTAYNPDTQPLLWSTALSPNGIYYKDAASNTLNGRLFCTFGSMRFNSGTSTALRDIPSAVRSASYTSVTVSVPANDGVTQTITLTGAAVGDFVVIQYAAALPDGIVQAWAMVTATDTVSVRFQNVTGSPISLTSFLIGALVYGRFT